MKILSGELQRVIPRGKTGLVPEVVRLPRGAVPLRMLCRATFALSKVNNFETGVVPQRDKTNVGGESAWRWGTLTVAVQKPLHPKLRRPATVSARDLHRSPAVYAQVQQLAVWCIMRASNQQYRHGG